MKFQFSTGKYINKSNHREKVKKSWIFTIFLKTTPLSWKSSPFLINRFGKLQQKDPPPSSYVWKYQLFFKPSLSWRITSKFSWYNAILTVVIFIHSFLVHATVPRIDVWHSLVRNVICRFDDFCTAIKPVLYRAQKLYIDPCFYKEFGWASRFLKFMNFRIC